MAMPQFTAEELYIINYVRAKEAHSHEFMWAYLLPGLVLAGLGAYAGSTAMMFSAFLVVCGLRVYEERYQSKWTPVFRSIFLKYDQAIQDVDGGPGRQNSN